MKQDEPYPGNSLDCVLKKRVRLSNEQTPIWGISTSCLSKNKEFMFLGEGWSENTSKRNAVVVMVDLKSFRVLGKATSIYHPGNSKTTHLWGLTTLKIVNFLLSFEPNFADLFFYIFKQTSQFGRKMSVWGRFKAWFFK